MVNIGPLAAEIVSLVWGTLDNFNGFHVLSALLHGTLVVGVSQTAAFNRGRHLYSAGRPSRWALAHISSFYYFQVCEYLQLTVLSDQWLYCNQHRPEIWYSVYSSFHARVYSRMEVECCWWLCSSSANHQLFWWHSKCTVSVLDTETNINRPWVRTEGWWLVWPGVHCQRTRVWFLYLMGSLYLGSHATGTFCSFH